MASLKLEELRVYQLSEKLADAVWELTRTWDSFPRQTTGIQLVRAADRIGANIAEGYGRGSFVDNKRFVRIARGSLYEVRHFLRRADKRGLISSSFRSILHPLLKELPPTLNGYLNAIGQSPRMKAIPTNDE